MFNKREPHETESGREPQARETQPGYSAREPAPIGRETPAAGRGGPTATIGPSIAIEGTLKGDEDLIVEGKIKGTVELKKNTLTIGSQGSLEAEVFAHTILVDGTVNGDLYAAERISIRKSARISGNILAPRISLDDGARFRGSIDMDAESEAFRKAFGAARTGAEPARAEPARAAQAGGGSAGASKAQTTQPSDKRDGQRGASTPPAGNTSGSGKTGSGSAA